MSPQRSKHRVQGPESHTYSSFSSVLSKSQVSYKFFISM
jgi:hypothetical protein